MNTTLVFQTSDQLEKEIFQFPEIKNKRHASRRKSLLSY